MGFCFQLSREFFCDGGGKRAPILHSAKIEGCMHACMHGVTFAGIAIIYTTQTVYYLHRFECMTLNNS